MRPGPKPAKSKAEAKPPAARKSPRNEVARVPDLAKRLAEAQEQQRATSEILAVISSSPTDLQPVFDTIIERAVRLCDARLGALFRFAGQMIHLAASAQQVDAESVQAMQTMYPMAASTASLTGRALLWGRPVHVRDMREDSELAQTPTAQVGHRTVLSVPMMRDGAPIGAITVARTRVEPFSDRQVDLLKTFADQAVIAIENVRLFNETKDALERQTATSEILRVISTLPAAVQPVFDVIARSARRLCGAADASIFRLEGDLARLVAHDGSIESRTVGEFAIPLVGPWRRLVESAQILHLADVQAEFHEFPEISENARRLGFCAVLGVPLLREGVVIGSINLRRREAQLFTARQISLLQTFADQAVIAIENVRLFTELQEKNRALTEAHAQVSEALEQQTATSEILRVISSSPTDVQPVFDTIIRSAATLCSATFGNVQRFDGEFMHLVAHYSHSPEWLASMQQLYPRRPDRTQSAS